MENHVARAAVTQAIPVPQRIQVRRTLTSESLPRRAGISADDRDTASGAFVAPRTNPTLLGLISKQDGTMARDLLRGSLSGKSTRLPTEAKVGSIPTPRSNSELAPCAPWGRSALPGSCVQESNRAHFLPRRQSLPATTWRPDLDTQQFQARPLFLRTVRISPAHLYGVASCPKYRVSLIWPPENPRDKIVLAGTKLSPGNSGLLPRCYGRSRRPTNLPTSPRLTSAQRNVGFVVNTSRRCPSSWLSSTKCSANKRSLICGEAS